jgi:YD repeat-containing protein
MRPWFKQLVVASALLASVVPAWSHVPAEHRLDPLPRHDPNNNLTNLFVVPPSGGPTTNAWTFDAYDRVATYRDADGNLMQYRYDPSGNLTNLVYPGGKNVFYAYDSLNRLTNVTDWANRKTSLEYDLASRVTKITRPNGTRRELTYDDAGQTTKVIERQASGNIIVLFRQSWSSISRAAARPTERNFSGRWLPDEVRWLFSPSSHARPRRRGGRHPGSSTRRGSRRRTQPG